MKVSFGSDTLRDCCCSAETADAKYGAHCAKLLFSLIADAEALDNAQEWHDFLVDDVRFMGDHTFEVTIGSEYVAVFVAVGRSFAVDGTGQVEWSSVTRLKLTDLARQP